MVMVEGRLNVPKPNSRDLTPSALSPIAFLQTVQLRLSNSRLCCALCQPLGVSPDSQVSRVSRYRYRNVE